MIPSGCPSALTTRTSFASIASLMRVWVSFAFVPMGTHLLFSANKNNSRSEAKARRGNPCRGRSPLHTAPIPDREQLLTERAQRRYGGSQATSLHCEDSIPQMRADVKSFSKKSFEFSHICEVNISQPGYFTWRSQISLVEGEFRKKALAAASAFCVG